MLKADGRLQDLELAIDDEKAREKIFIRNIILVEIGIMAQPFTFCDADGWLHAEKPDFS